MIVAQSEPNLRALAWLLKKPGPHREYLQRALADAIEQVVRARKVPLSESELELLGDVGQDADKRLHRL